MQTTPLHPRFGVEVHGVRLAEVTAEAGYPEIRELFERHSLLLFRDQHLDDDAHLAFGALFGPIEIRSKAADKGPAKVSQVSNVSEGRTVSDERERHLMNLKANQLWHTDSTFLPVPALANILTARVVPATGGETEVVSTRAAFADLSPEMQATARKAVLVHRYAHSRAKIDPSLATDALFTMWEDQAWRAVWTNPVTGEEALYLASHVHRVEGMDEAEGTALIEALTAHATRPELVYTHAWRPGDVLMWDQRATMHRGRPWPYGQPRTLASICVSVTGADGLEAMRPAA